MSLGQIRERTDQLRSIPLEWVLRACAAQPDRYDPRKWHTSQGVLSIRGAKFINWNRGEGGGGAIDLAIHLNHLSFPEALAWLQRHFPRPALPSEAPLSLQPPLRMPPPDSGKLWRVQSYLARQRSIPHSLLDTLLQSGALYADHRANAVFPLLGEANLPVGAELRGTTSRPWHGMAPGSRKDLGFFSAPIPRTPCQGIILCESAIDALSCSFLHPHHRCLSTAGARPNLSWLAPLIEQGQPLYCGFDADPTGDSMAHALISLHPTVQRLRPPRHDWNDLLKYRS